MWNELKLVYYVADVRKAYGLWKMQRYTKNQQPDKREYLYCCFWGIAKKARGGSNNTAKEMKDAFIQKAQETQLPIYAETRKRRNALAYQRYGFKIFHTWKRPDGDTSYFIRYNPFQEIN